MRRSAITGATMLLTAMSAPAAQAAACMDSEPQIWLTSASQRTLYERLVGYLACPDDRTDGPLSDVAACNYFAGRVLKDVWGIADFARPGGGWLTANEIATHVARPTSGWSRVGLASSQTALASAAQAAGNGDAVLAVKSGTPGHVSLILPGDLRRSGNWNLDVPNSASFALGNPDKAYVFCRLSYAFSASDGIAIYRKARP